MGNSIKNRVFGSDVPTIIKKKIESRQLLARKDRSPNEQIKPSNYPDDRPAYYSHGDLNEMNFGGVADLSSRTPFARMWTAVNISKDSLIKTLTKEDALIWENAKEDADSADVDYKNKFLREIGENDADKKYEVHEWVEIDNTEKIYVLGNHVLGTEQVGPNTPRSVAGGSGAEGVSAAIVKELTPFEQETDMNAFLKPPAGITGITSETQGALGTIKKTTVNFIVHNFSDFEQIYLRYFMKPGAQVFVDFGWDTGFLYDPKELLKDHTKIEDKLYGDTGYVTLSRGDMESLYGHVVNYDASVREDGGFDCSVEIVSKNTALLSNSFDRALKDRVKYGLDIEIMGYAVSGVLGDYNIYKKATSWGQAATTESELRYAFTVSTIKLLGGTTAPLPGMSDTETSMAALEQGVFYAGTMEENMKLFVNYGWFEDKFLNKELGFSDSKKELTNNDKTGANNDEGSLKAKFNSQSSFITYNEKLKRAMSMRGFYEGAMFLYPDTWGSAGPTYNTEKGMIPLRFDDEGNEVTPEDYGMTHEEFQGTFEEFDKEEGKIPLREIFISVDAIKSSFDISNTTSEFLKSIMGKIKDASGGIVDMGMQSNNYGGHTLSFIDKGLLNKGASSPSVNGELSDFLKKLLVFSPYSPDTIVKEYDISFSMPQDGLGNMIGIQASDSLGNVQSLSDMLDGLMKLEEMDRKGIVDKFVRYIPSVGQESGRRLIKNKGRESAGTFNFSDTDIATGNTNKIPGNSVNLDGNTKVGTSYDEYAVHLGENLNKAMDPNLNLEGEDTTPEPEEEKTVEDTKKSEEELAKKNSESLVATPYDFWIKDAVGSHISTLAPLLPIEVSLKIYGISSLVPGDLIRVNYLPKVYYLNAYFQVMQISQTIDTTWTTALTTKMRIAPFDRPLPKTAVTVGKSYLRNVLKLDAIDSFIHVFGNLKPIDISGQMKTRLNYIDNIFECTAVGSIKDGDDFDLPPLWSTSTVGELKKSFTSIKWGKWNDKDNGVSVKFVSNTEWTGPLQELWPFGDKDVDYAGANVVVKGLKKGTTFYIITTGTNWIIWTGAWDKVKMLDINRLFSLTHGKQISQDLKDKSWKALGQEVSGAVGTAIAPVTDYIGEKFDAIEDGIDAAGEKVSSGLSAVGNAIWTGFGLWGDDK